MTIASGASRIEMNCDVENMPTAAARVAAVELDDEARDRVEQHVEPERPARERPALRSVASSSIRISDSAPPRTAASGAAARSSGVPTLAAANGSVNVIAHGTRRRLAVAAAGEEAAEPADDVAERDAGREHVARRPERQADAADVPERDDDGEDQAAVEHAARARERQQLARIGA